MKTTTKYFAIIGAFMMMLAVVFGAFGAHALKDILNEHMMDVYKTGVEYHFYHALGLFCVSFVSTFSKKTKLIKFAGYFMFVGIVLFSGSLYILSYTGISWIGIITPIGGLSFIVAWILLILSIGHL